MKGKSRVPLTLQSDREVSEQRHDRCLLAHVYLSKLNLDFCSLPKDGYLITLELVS